MSSVPILFTISLVINSLTLLLAVFFLASLIVHFRKPPETRGDPIAENLAKWMSRGAFGAILAGFPWSIILIVHYGSRSLDNTGCLFTENIPGLFLGIHKFSVYTFIYFRVKTFQDFFTPRGWTRLKYFAGTAACIYLLIILFAVPYVVFAAVETFDTSGGWCRKTARNNGQLLTVIGVFAIFMDVIVAVVGTTSFVYVLFFGDTLSQIARKDPEIAKAGKNVALWSSVALISTVVAIGSSLAADWVSLGSLDIAISSFCVCKQYPECLTSLLRLVFQYDEEEAVEMAPGTVVSTVG